MGIGMRHPVSVCSQNPSRCTVAVQGWGILHCVYCGYNENFFTTTVCISRKIIRQFIVIASVSLFVSGPGFLSLFLID